MSNIDKIDKTRSKLDGALAGFIYNLIMRIKSAYMDARNLDSIHHINLLMELKDDITEAKNLTLAIMEFYIESSEFNDKEWTARVYDKMLEQVNKKIQELRRDD